jgi:hypothetical protein
MNKRSVEKKQISYQSYLLRLWHAQKPGAPYRAMLECVTEPGKQHYFKDLESLMAYLLTQPGPAPETAETEGVQDS